MLIPYLGEKSRLSNFITPNIPTDIKTYVEPFSGMLGVFFSLNFTKFKDVDFIYNDINFLNYNLFNQLKFNDDFIYNGGYLEQNLQLEHFDNSDYYNYDPVDNGGVDFNTIDSHMKFAEKLSKDHNKSREANFEFQETPYVKTDARSLWRPNLA